MQIRLALPQDVPALARIYNEAVVDRIATADTEPRSLEDRQAWFVEFDAKHPLWVGEEEGKIEVYGGLFRYSPKNGYRFAAESCVYVGRSARGRGLGKAMMEWVVRESERLGFRYLLARIFGHNQASIGLHVRLGFQELGIQRRIVLMDGTWYDVVLMDLHLGGDDPPSGAL